MRRRIALALLLVLAIGLALGLGYAITRHGLTASIDAVADTEAPTLTDGASSRTARGSATQLSTVESDGAQSRVAVRPAGGGWLVRGRAWRAPERPAPGAKIHALAFRGAKAEGRPLVETHLVAAADGSFVWTLDPPSTVTFLYVRGEGERVRSYPQEFLVAAGDPPPEPFGVWVSPLDGTVTGRVLDEEGKPIGGARVSTADTGGVDTDADGRFAVEAPIGNQARLRASKRGFVATEQELTMPDATATATATAELRMRRAFHVRGRVIDAERHPVAGATVRTFQGNHSAAAQTDAEGRFELDDLDPSVQRQTVFARCAGWIEARVEVKPSDGNVEHELVLRRGVAVRGGVFGPRGEPVPAARISLSFSSVFSAGASRGSYERLDTVSDDAGRFELVGVAPGEQTLSVERAGLSGKRMTIAVPPAPASPLEVRVELEQGHFIAGVVTDEQGTALPKVEVFPRLNGEYLGGRTRSDAAGRFRMVGVPAAGLALEFAGRGLLRKSVRVPAVDRDDLVVKMEPHGRMAGTVVDGATGQPIPRFRIRFGRPRLERGESPGSGYSSSWVSGGRVLDDARGIFRVDEEVPIGSVFALEASADGYGPLIHDHVVATREADPTQLVFALYPGAVISGFVRERDGGHPIAGARLKASARARPVQPDRENDDEGRPIATTDARGAFRLENVGQGEFTIVVEHPQWITVRHGPVRVAPSVPVPAQEIVMAKGVTITVEVRAPDGSALPNGEVELVPMQDPGERARTRAGPDGVATFERVAPGEYELALVVDQLWMHSRRLRVEQEARRVELCARDGDATLAVLTESADPIPDSLFVAITRKQEDPTPGERAFRRRNVRLVQARALLTHLPACELEIGIHGYGNEGTWTGHSTVTTRAGATTELRITLTKTRVLPR